MLCISEVDRHALEEGAEDLGLARSYLIKRLDRLRDSLGESWRIVSVTYFFARRP